MSNEELKVNLEPDKTIPIVSPDYISDIYESVIAMEVPLDENPLDYDPSRLNSKIEKCRAFLDIVERKSQLSNRDFHTLNSRFILEKKLYDIKERRLFSDNAEVRALGHVEDRKRAAATKLEKELESLAWIEGGIADHKAMLEALKMKRADLKNTQSQIKEQVKLCNESIGLGLKWGRNCLPMVNLSAGIGQSHIDQSIKDAEEAILLAEESGDIDLPELEDQSEATPELEGEIPMIPDLVEESEDLDNLVGDLLTPSEDEPEVDEAEEMAANLEQELDGILEGGEKTSEGETKGETEDDSDVDAVLGSDAMAQAATPDAPEAEEDDEEFSLDELLS